MSRIIFLGTSYSVISSTQLCGHVDVDPSVDDPYPARCVREKVYDSECKDDCTSFDWCIAYGASHDGNECWLITSTGSCPNGWACHCTSATGITAIATQSSDLIPSGLSGFNCMAKGI